MKARTIPELVDLQANENANKAFLEYHHYLTSASTVAQLPQSLSFAEFRDRVVEVAPAFMSLGIKRGSVCAFLINGGTNFNTVVAPTSVICIGGVAAMINARFPVPVLSQMLKKYV